MTAEKRARGSGRVYRRGRWWWMEFWTRGRQVRMSAETRRQNVAERRLRKELEKAERGEALAVDVGRTRFAYLVELLRADYEANGRAGLATLDYSLRAVRRHFERVRVIDIDYAALSAYVTKRLASGSAPATVRRELALLRRALVLGARSGKVGVQTS